VWIGPREHKVVGAMLAEARERAGMKQQDLAKRLRKPQSFVSAYENGQRRIDVLEFIRIATALGANPRQVFAEIVSARAARKHT